jgi:hypothetical protein
MHQERVLTIGVECYSGHRGEHTPRSLVLGDLRIVVIEVVDAWLAPDYRYFKVKGEDGNTYLVRHDESSKPGSRRCSARNASTGPEVRNGSADQRLELPSSSLDHIRQHLR